MTRTADHTIVIADTPPSMNTYSHAHWRKFHSIKKTWQAIFAEELMVLRREIGRAGSVHATASLRFPQRRRRDEGNYRAALEKALGDALVQGGFLVDDTPEYFTFGAVTFEEEKGANQTTVILRCTKGEAKNDKDG